MTEEKTYVTTSTVNNKMFFIHRPDGSEIKVFVSETNKDFRHYYPIGNHYLISPVVLSDSEVKYFHENLLLID